VIYAGRFYSLYIMSASAHARGILFIRSALVLEFGVC